ncbi:secreted insulinase-like peptidase [Cryptosporidium canis]|uniref:Secreted insulinase-like peptidase n=1 Tax=Cryptosporidium canis TaxID=195482 RepID=A0ABQ8PBJ8_9CRYT|nr:secreted insulinase-like peptidase [Cryptosporidium canis]
MTASLRTLLATWSVLLVGLLHWGLGSAENCTADGPFANGPHDSVWRSESIKAVVDDDMFVKPKIDKAKYRYIKLKNGLKAFLVSKEDAERSEVAISVDVGFQYDPPKIIGLSNLVQHSLLLASQQYPNIDEFHNFIKLLNGRIYLDLFERSSIYSFTIGTEYLSESIYRFSSYFHRPLLNNDSINKALLTIFNQLNRIRRNEVWVRREIEREVSAPNSNFEPFYYGNKNTLLNNPALAEGEIYEKVRHYFSKYYGPNNMRLAIVGRESLDKLEKYVIRNFAHIKRNWLNIVNTEDSYNYMVNPFIRIAGNIITIRKLKRTRVNTINLRFPIELQLVNWRRIPTLYFKYLLDGNYKGILRRYLKSLGISTPVRVSVVSYEGFSTLDVSIDLFNGQLKHSWAVVRAVISAVKFIIEKPVSEKVLLEAKRIADIIFNYRESDFAKDLAYNIVYKYSRYKAKPHEIIYADEVMEVVDVSFVRSFMNSISIDGVSIFFFTPVLVMQKGPPDYKIFRSNFYSRTFNSLNSDVAPGAPESPGSRQDGGAKVMHWIYNTIKYYLIKFLAFVFQKELYAEETSIKKEMGKQDPFQDSEDISKENQFVECSVVLKSANLQSDYCVSRFPKDFFQEIHSLTSFEIQKTYELDIYTLNPYTPLDLSLSPKEAGTKTTPQPLLLSIKKYLNQNIQSIVSSRSSRSPDGSPAVSGPSARRCVESAIRRQILQERDRDRDSGGRCVSDSQPSSRDGGGGEEAEAEAGAGADYADVSIMQLDFYSNIVYFYYKSSAEKSFPEAAISIRIQTPRLRSKMGSYPRVLRVIPRMVAAIEVLCAALEISLDDEMHNFRVTRNEFKISSFSDYTYNGLPNGFEITLKGFYDVLPTFLKKFAAQLSYPRKYLSVDKFEEAMRRVSGSLHHSVYFTPSITRSLIILRSITENQNLTPFDRLNELKYVTYQDIVELSEFFARRGQVEGIFMNNINPLRAGQIVDKFLDSLGRSKETSGTVSFAIKMYGVEIVDHEALQSIFEREAREYSVKNMLVPISHAGESYFNSYELLDMTTLPLRLWRSYRFEYSSINEEKSISSLALLIGTKTPFTISLVALLCIFLSDLINKFLKRISNETDNVTVFSPSYYSVLTFMVIQVESYSKDVASLSEFLILFINEIFETPYIIEKNFFYKVKRDCIEKFRGLPNNIELFSLLFYTFIEGTDLPFQWIEKVIHTMETLSYNRFIKSIKFLHKAPQIIIAVQSKISNRTYRIDKYVPKGFTMLNSTDDLLNQENLYIYKLPIDISRNVLSQEL